MTKIEEAPKTGARNGKPTRREAWSMVMWGGLGGTLPTLGKIAGMFGANFDAPALNFLGVAGALIIFAVMGAIVARGIENTDVRQSLFAGIAAPAVVVSIVTGVSDGRNQRTQDNPQPTFQKKETPKKDQQNGRLNFFAPARAEEVLKGSPDFLKRDLGVPGFTQARPGLISWSVGGGIRLRNDISIFAEIVTPDGSKPPYRVRIGEFTPNGNGQLTLAIPADANRLQFVASNGVQTTLDLPPLQPNQSGWNIALALDGRASVRDDFKWILGFGRSLDIRAIAARLQ